jgi:hypothetical protein
MNTIMRTRPSGLLLCAVAALLVVALAPGCSDTDGRFTLQSDAATTDIGGGLVCADPLSPCRSMCLDLSSDPANCGTCGFACASDQMCVSGRCLGACPTGQTRCGQRCVNLQTDRTSCGTCERACAAGLVCSEGECAPTCGPMYARCDVLGDAGVRSDAGGRVTAGPAATAARRASSAPAARAR